MSNISRTAIRPRCTRHWPVDRGAACFGRASAAVIDLDEDACRTVVEEIEANGGAKLLPWDLTSAMKVLSRLALHGWRAN